MLSERHLRTSTIAIVTCLIALPVLAADTTSIPARGYSGLLWAEFRRPVHRDVFPKIVQRRESGGVHLSDPQLGPRRRSRGLRRRHRGLAGQPAEAIGGADESAWLSTTINPAQLVAGTNVIAVEMHQNPGTSSDIGFNLSLVGSDGVSVTREPYLQMGSPNAMTVAGGGPEIFLRHRIDCSAACGR